ncbi:helix-turn-helix domain-containing protein [Clostridium saccharoperbutylacetonicum]|uniref:helix-turn-helix domain-containing protein n=1 Tax=Clostridium saccharoperbutylacetonicum TaxID=36745 RepID=UPI000983A92F|nr:helix-turn-helix transcriptional regulator [Clostridium saccharoperbutylacetonicum]AQR95517.1 helix-turn-helix domain protein [Clostridium saccharoperbutylacetonicum]NSB31377.1 transcriptional regulator with XRE-family HTH domain [Clostridium saccharoperbutylacetonicum]
MKDEFGQKIKEIRIKKNISQFALARKLKSLNQSQICKIENGNRHVRVNELEQIAYALNVTIAQLTT